MPMLASLTASITLGGLNTVFSVDVNGMENNQGLTQSHAFSIKAAGSDVETLRRSN